MTAGVADTQEYVRGLLDSCKGISAKDAADRAGIPLVKKGSRYWTRCFIHKGDKTASMVFYEDGRFYCHGCKESGDAVRVYERVYDLKPVHAANRLRADFGLPAYDDGLKTRTIDPVERETRRIRDAEKTRAKRRQELLDLAMDIGIRMHRTLGELTADELTPFADRIRELKTAERALLDKVEKLDALADGELLAWAERGASVDDLR